MLKYPDCSKLFFALPLLLLPLSSCTSRSAHAQADAPLRVDVVLVQLNIAVTDKKGNYVTGLKPEDFVISEDNIQENPRTFEEGQDVAPHRIDQPQAQPQAQPPTAAAPASGEASELASVIAPSTKKEPETGEGLVSTTGNRFAGANVFVLFDTSNYMYTGFVFAQDAIADFIRSLEGVSKVALYSYSRNLSRVSTLTPNRTQLLQAVRSTVAGDNAALYNSLLLTVKDAAPLTGRKAIVVFSNGPDDASLVPPEDIAELAQSTGTIIYMISTRVAEAEPISAAVFERMSKATGGRAFFSKDWQDEKKAFAAIRDDLAHLYTISYYPLPNPNRGWRNINVKLVGKDLQKYHVRTRDGYRLIRTQVSAGTATTGSGSE